MNGNYEKLCKLLVELFQLDQADLDFGIYRIMNQKRDEITNFMDNDLLPQVQEAFKEYGSSDMASIQAELDKAIQQARSLGVDPENAPKVKGLRSQLSQSIDVTKLENEVFSDLYDFFRRYYHEGDFISLRRYKEGVYAIPYEGEEVKLYWANHDQYYVKTSEYFRDYTFKLRSGKRVHFKIVEADTEKDNQKTQAGRERRFILSEVDPIAEVDGELHIRFEYKPDPDNRKQNQLSSETIQRIRNVNGFTGWLRELMEPSPTESNSDRTLLEKHLTDYTARNTFDYFIHKDLGGFLRRELDFYIKNEVMRLDDIENESAPKVEQYLSKIKVIRNIAHKIIDFLAQIENFQKKLWLKKKFVVETNYCVTLDRVPEELYPEIIANDAQHEEWVNLFAIDEIKGDLTTASYSVPLTEEFLKANPFLVLDTRFFSQEFKDALLASFEDIDEQCDGLLIHSENFQALKLLDKCFKGKVKCIYIDPPYNSPSSEILYKNDFKHSSWLSLMQDRLLLSERLNTDDGSTVVAIDKHEHNGLFAILSQLHPNNDIVSVSIEHNKKGTQGEHFSFSNEYAIFSISPKMRNLNRVQLPEEEWEYANLRNWGGESLRSDARNCFYPIFVKDDEIIGFGDICLDDFHPGSANIEKGDNIIEVYPIDAEGVERKWRYARDTVESIKNLLKIDTSRNGDIQILKAKADAQFKTLWYSSLYNAGDYGTKILSSMGFDNMFDYPKSIYTVRDCIFAVSGKSDLLMDYFAGSGTTAHAVINLNREDEGNRKYILVEMGEYFDTVMKPRIQKVIYSKDWRDGKPISREGSSHLFKYIRLESYEDTLNNLELKRIPEQDLLLAQSKSFRESYMLSYMLDIESNGSPSLLNIDRFEDPFNYKLNISTGSVGETKPVNVDLVETFNYLIGLTVQHIDYIRGFRVVQGTNPRGEKVLIIWRNLKEKSNADLDGFFRKQEYNPRDMEFDLIYVNGDNNLENIRRPDEMWKVRLIEDEFQRLMFDVENV